MGAKNYGKWDTAIRGSSALRAAILSLFVDELASYNKMLVTRILWDMEKFYDTISIILLISRARGLGFPMLLLALGL